VAGTSNTEARDEVAYNDWMLEENPQWRLGERVGLLWLGLPFGHSRVVPCRSPLLPAEPTLAEASEDI
jgi:hypothetical protein